MTGGKVLVASQSFVLWDAGRMVRFRRNRTTIREGHPLLVGNEQRFRPQKVDFDVAMAPRPTAAPVAAATIAPHAGRDLTCPHCGMVAGSAIGLSSHIRAKHPD